MNYAEAIDTIRELPERADGILLWEFPEEDFAAYLAMPDTPPLESHGHYLAALAAIQADVERTGRLVRRVRVPVATMIAELKRRNWPNDTQYRARLLGELGGH